MKTWRLLKNNPHLWQRYFIKEYIIKACRQFFEQKNYHELESPLFTNALPQERYLNPFELDLRLNQKTSTKAYITPTTETFNKKILVAGLGNHFVISKVARNMEEIGINHLPEFTMIEWYDIGCDYFDLMKDCEDLIIFIFDYIEQALRKEKMLNRFMVSDEVIQNFNNLKLYFQDLEIFLEKPWERISISDALKNFAKIKLEEIQTEDELRSCLEKKGHSIDSTMDWQLMFEFLFATYIEPNISKTHPVFIYDYPKQICVLTKQSAKNPLVCERTELYIAGKEIANGYTELNEWKQQDEHFKIEQKARKNLGLPDINYDYDLIEALKEGMPNVAGIGMGLDRLAMIFANAKSISDINYFPASEWDE